MKKVLTATLVLALALTASSSAFAAAAATAPAQKTQKTAAVSTAKTTNTGAAKTTPAKTETAPAEETGKISPMPAGETETEKSLLVTPEWLKANLNKVILVDGRPADLYAHNHIPGAVSAPWTYFANMNAKNGTKSWGTVWKSGTMAKRIGALGINGKKTVVCYSDAGDWGQGGWIVWVLRMAGIKNAKLLDGGIYAWKNEKGKLSTTHTRNKAVPFSIKRYKTDYLVDTEWIKANLGKANLVILDVRTPKEYEGKIRPFKEKRAGHLPSAVSIPIDEFLTKDGKYKTKEEVVSMLSEKQITPESEIVVYDTAGVRAAFVTMLLRYAGFSKSQCYDEGFQAWAGSAELPIE